MWLASMATGEIALVYSFMIIATLKTRRKLGRVNFCKDFWGCYWAKGKNWPIADRRVPSNDPRNNCGTHFGSSPLLVSKEANSFTLSLAHCIVCSITAGNDLSVQWGTSSSGGSRLKRDTYEMITDNKKKINNSFLGGKQYGRLMSVSYIHSEGPVSSSALNTIRVCFLVVPSSSPQPSL